jgi:hypothetical protein
VGRPRILVAATLGRADLLAMFEGAAEHADLTFVEYASTPGLSRELYEPYGRLTTWDRHRSARALLREVEPDLLVMIAIRARNQLALRREAKRCGLRMVHLEHGYRLPMSTQLSLAVDRDKVADPASPPPAKSSLADNRFFVGSLLRLPPAEAARLARYALPSVGGPSLETVASMADLRWPDRYVSFAPECFEFHRELDRVPPQLAERTLYVGFPLFDCFRADRAPNPDAGTVVVVDHQLHNTGFLGWNPRFHEEWVEGVHDAVVASGRRIVVKTHPNDRSSRWTGYADGSVEIVPSIEALERHAGSAPVALGIMSTLQLPLAGLPHMTTITVEVHPRPREMLSARLVEAGVAHPVHSFDELRAALDRAPELHRGQLPGKPAFVERFLHRLDGRAGERLTGALLAEAGGGEAAA